MGSILLCWVFVRWQDNLWAPFAVHAMMNLWWELFGVDDSALGGWYANGARLATVALGILLSLHKDRLWPRLAGEDANVAYAQTPPPATLEQHRVERRATDIPLSFGEAWSQA